MSSLNSVDVDARRKDDKADTDRDGRRERVKKATGAIKVRYRGRRKGQRNGRV